MSWIFFDDDCGDVDLCVGGGDGSDIGDIDRGIGLIVMKGDGDEGGGDGGIILTSTSLMLFFSVPGTPRLQIGLWISVYVAEIQ